MCLPYESRRIGATPGFYQTRRGEWYPPSMPSDRARWNAKYRKGVTHDNPNVRLIMYRERLAPGRALDVAGGIGENAAILALAGWNVTLCDVSDEAVRRARERARGLRTAVAVVQADALRLPFKGPFDLVVCTYYLDRTLVGPLVWLLRPGGTLFFESFTLAHLKHAPDFRRDFCLEPGELRTMFPLQEVLYREEDDGERAFAMLIARKTMRRATSPPRPSGPPRPGRR